MGKITKILSDEHKNILRLTKLIEKECESGENINKDFFIKAIYFIRNYADKFHHAKEEDILFSNSDFSFFYKISTFFMFMQHLLNWITRQFSLH